MVDEPASRYPHAADGRIAVPADADWLDPLVGLSFAAAATTRIGLATGPRDEARGGRAARASSPAR
jgi:hypothetical protein